MLKISSRTKITAMHLLALLVFVATSRANATSAQCSGLFRSASSSKSTIAATNGPIGKIEVNALTEVDRGARVKQDIEIITRVANELGLATPPHQLNVVPSEQLGVLASTGGHPAPHWFDGSELVSARGSARGVMEFVTKGCPKCRAYYSASTPHEEQREVMVHVIGHNDQSMTSSYQRIRPGDSQLASYQRAVALGKASRENNHDQVALYYQFLKSLSSLQDYANGTFEDPSKFSIANNAAPLRPAESVGFWEKLAAPAGGMLENLLPRPEPRAVQPEQGWFETPSVLQAMTEMLPPDAPEWQRSLLKLEEQSNRMFPAIAQTQIMNEGWATLMMYVVARHLPWTSSSDLVKYAQLLSGVTRMSFTNPYWIGVSGWRNLYDQFLERPEIKGLSEFEKDKRFITESRKMYANKNDSQWVKIALDQRWIEKNRFFLYRPTQKSELDPDKDPEKQANIALTRNWKRIQNFIVDQYVDNKRRRQPSIRIRNPNRTPGQILLIQDTALNIPLEIYSTAKTLFVIAQVLRQPTQIEALFEAAIFKGTPFWEKYKDTPEWQDGVVVGKMGVTVGGKVTLEVQGEHDAEGSQQLADVIDGYKKSVVGSYQDDFTDFQMRQWTRVAVQVGDHAAGPAAEIVTQAPHTGAAVREYLQVVEHRLYQAMRDVIAGRTKMKFTSNGVRLSVLPEVPRFRYAHSVLQARIARRAPAPIDYPGAQYPADFHLDENGSAIQIGSLMPGDKWGKPEKGGEGKGKGKGQGPPPPDDPEPEELDIPRELWGEMLRGLIKLPNPRETSGKLKQIRPVHNGTVSKTSGIINWNQTVMKAVNKVNAIRKSRGLPYGSAVPWSKQVQEAMKMIEPSDYRVKGTINRPVPTFSAVLFVKIDSTASMSGPRIEAAQAYVFNLRAALEAEYGKGAVEVVWIGFNNKAKELTEEEAFKTFFGGSTSYASGTKLVRNIIQSDRFPRGKYNFYDVTIGDCESSREDATENIEVLSELSSQLQHAGLVVTNDDMQFTEEIVGSYKQLQSDWKWVGVTQLRENGDIFKALKETFLVEVDQN